MNENIPQTFSEDDKVVLNFRFEQYSFTAEEAKDLADQLEEAANELDE